MERLSGFLRFGSLTPETDAYDYPFLLWLETDHLRGLPPKVEALGTKESLGL
jgi:hypothetical protein